MKNLKLVIFDMDGLMFDTEVFYCDRIEDYCKEKDIAIDIGALHNVIGTSNPMDMDHFNQSEYPNDYVQKIADEAHELSLAYVTTHGAPIKEGLYELLDYLKSEGIQMVVATSTRIEISKPILELANVYNDLLFLITGQEVKNGKPNPDIFLEALRRSGFKKEEALILEDSINGGLAAKNAKIPYIIVPDINPPTEEIQKEALSIEKSLLTVLDLIKKSR